LKQRSSGSIPRARPTRETLRPANAVGDVAILSLIRQRLLRWITRARSIFRSLRGKLSDVPPDGLLFANAKGLKQWPWPRGSRRRKAGPHFGVSQSAAVGGYTSDGGSKIWKFERAQDDCSASSCPHSSALVASSTLRRPDLTSRVCYVELRKRSLELSFESAD
jgi:hypothetical protein